ncbi:hypothetical protein AAFC00_004817 [Neodothiora populina]|uniref:BRCT domain-containing protein n=1 Tax=Neodothiora populina TaxID=2781224 RepID=A0ABR3P3K2_9PEZI
MFCWRFVLEDASGVSIESHDVDMHEDIQLLHIEGILSNTSSWHFTQFGDDTQAKNDYICDIEIKTGSAGFTSEIDGIRIRQPPFKEGVHQTLYFDLPTSGEKSRYVALLRPDDIVEFKEQCVQLKVALVQVAKHDPNIEVRSSAVHISPVKHVAAGGEYGNKDHMLAGDLTGPQDPTATEARPVGEDTQDPYSTGLERLSASPHRSPTAGITRPSQIIQESPIRPTMHQQASTISRVAESLPFSSLIGERATGMQSPFAMMPEKQASDSLGESQVERRSRRVGRSVLSSVEHSNVSAQYDIGMTDDGRTGDENWLDHSPEADTLSSKADPNPNHPPTPSAGSDDARQNHLEHDDSPDAAMPHVEAQTPEPGPQGRKRKIVTYGKSGQHNSTSKRKKTTTEPKMPILSNESTRDDSPSVARSEESARRTSSRLSASQRADSPSPSAVSSERSQKTNKQLRILFPSVSRVKSLAVHMRFLKDHHVKEAKDQNPKSFDIFCVDQGELKTTAKLLISLVHGKTIVTDDWVSKSIVAKQLLDTGPFLPTDLKASKDKDRSQMFGDVVMYFTPKLRKDYGKGWDDIQAIIKQTGATIVSCAPTRIPKNVEVDFYLASEKDDAHLVELQEKSICVYHKDILTQSILAGELFDEDPYELPTAPVAEAASNGKAAASTRTGKTRKK